MTANTENRKLPSLFMSPLSKGSRTSPLIDVSNKNHSNVTFSPQTAELTAKLQQTSLNNDRPTSQGEVNGQDLPKHLVALINSIPDIIHFKRENRSKIATKRLALESSLPRKKCKGPLESIKENETPSRNRSDSAPTPSTTENLKSTPSKASSISDLTCVTPLSVKGRKRISSVRKISASKSLAALDEPSLIVNHDDPIDDGDGHPLIGDRSSFCLLECRLCNGVPLVNCSELAKLLEGTFVESVSRVYVIDCRFPYEFEGGHIKGAGNFPHPFFDRLRKVFFDDINSVPEHHAAWVRPADFPEEGIKESRIIVVFHCEFSSHRAPNTFRWFRTEDRNDHNIASYPQLYYPEAYVLSGGYKAFVNYCNDHGKPALCHPQGGYIKQTDSRYTDELRSLQRRIKTMGDIEECLIETHQESQFGDDNELIVEKQCWKKAQLTRRRSECPPRSLMPSFVRTSFEDMPSACNEHI